MREKENERKKSQVFDVGIEATHTGLTTYKMGGRVYYSSAFVSPKMLSKLIQLFPYQQGWRERGEMNAQEWDEEQVCVCECVCVCERE